MACAEGWILRIFFSRHSRNAYLLGSVFRGIRLVYFLSEELLLEGELPEESGRDSGEGFAEEASWGGDEVSCREEEAASEAPGAVSGGMEVRAALARATAEAAQGLSA